MKHKIKTISTNNRYPWSDMGIGDWFEVTNKRLTSVRRAMHTAMRRLGVVFQLSATNTGIRVERVA